jgi:hypothetical protein
MALFSSPYRDWDLLTPLNIQLRRTWPWAHSIQKLVGGRHLEPFKSKHFFVFSDYGGSHKSATHLTYSYLFFEDLPSIWLREVAILRRSTLTDGRRISFKRMNDGERQRAIVPFLQAADSLPGHLVTIAVDKRKRQLATGANSLQLWRRLHGLNGKWNSKSFEDMARKCLFFAVLTSVFGRPRSNISWITDQDEFVANEHRLDDAQNFAARILAQYIPEKSGIFAMNHAAIDAPDLQYEDLCSVPDLAAGMTADICSELSALGRWESGERRPLPEGEMQPKTSLLSDWYGFTDGALMKSLILIDDEGPKYSVRLIEIE